MISWLKKTKMVRSTSKQRSARRIVRRPLIIEQLDARLPLAIETQLVKDINSATEYTGSKPQNLVVVGSVVYFTASTNTAGEELWKSDGTSSGTVMVKDILPGSQGSAPKYLTNMNGMLYFQANDGTNGIELWKSDGTVSGTVMVKDILSISGGYGPRFLTNINGTIYFEADDGITGPELWKSDGTAAGMLLVKDIRSGAGRSEPREFTNVNGILYFRASSGSTYGYELWKSDGTNSGTVRVKDIRNGGDSYPRFLTNVSGMLYFQANDGLNGVELWRSDGTSSGTVLVKDIKSGSNNSTPRYLTNVNGTLYFNADDGINGYELWKSDGTNAGTVMISNLEPGNSSSSPHILTNINGMLYFRAVRNNSTQYELWKSNGTVDGTVMIRNNVPRYLTNVNGTVYFAAKDATNGVELWKSDGTTNGTVMVKNIRPSQFSSYPRNLANLNGTLFFSAYDGEAGYELWKSDGNSSGTVMVKDIMSGSQSIDPKYLTNVNGNIYFSVTYANNSNVIRTSQLWKSDGSNAGTSLLNEFRAISETRPKYLTNVNGTLFFQANDGSNGTELWKSDGTVGGTVMVKNIRPAGGDANPKNLINMNGVLYFTANDGTNGYELWKSDGTSTGTELVKNIGSGGLVSSNPRYLTNVNGTLFFRAYGSGDGELWRSDGTATGTTLVRSFSAIVNGNSVLTDLTNVNGTLYFQARELGVTGSELWKWDSVLGATLVKDIVPGGNSSTPKNLVNVNGTLHFTAVDGTNGRELWKSDGTGEGTVLVKNIWPGNGSSNATSLTNVNGLLFFQANDGTNGYELWKSDGTASGTMMLKDIQAGNASSELKYLTNFMGILYFSANSGLGAELWKSDGTTTGTQSLAEFVPRNTIFEPKNLLSLGSSLFYTPITDEYGVELWKLTENKSPTDLFLSSITMVENEVANAIVGTFTTADPNPGDTFTYTLVMGTGDNDNAAFTINGSTLRATNSFDFETKSGYTVRVRSTDQGGLFTEKAFTITVTNVSETPTDIDLTPRNLTENAGANATIGTLSSTDPDVGNTFTYTLVTGTGDNDNSDFNISGSSLRATNSFDFETKSSYTVRVRSTDQSGLFIEKDFTIAVTDVNESPTDIDLSPRSIAENAGANATVGTLSTFDQDAGDTFAYTFAAGSGDADNASFNIIGSTLRATNSFDFETKSSYTVRVRSTDQGGLFIEKAFTIAVINDNETPTDIDLVPKSIAENAGANATVGALTTTDPDVGNTFTYTLVMGTGDTDNAAFSISGSSLRATSSFDFETKSSHTVRVRSTDDDGLFTEKAFAITVTDVNESPTDIDLSPKSIAENAGANATVGALATTDPDAGNSFTYSLVAGTGDADNAAFNINGSILQATNDFDFETKSSYTVRVRSTDQGGLFTEKAFTIDVRNINETPTDINLLPKSIAENSGANATVGVLSTTDQDAGDSFTYSLVAGSGDADNSAFNISDSTLRAMNSFDFETKLSYTVRVRSTDQGGLFVEKVFTIAVANVNEAPTDIDLSPQSIAENAGTDARVGTLSTIDPDAANTFSYTLVVGAGDSDNSAFNISGSTLRATNSFDFATKSIYTARIRSTDQAGLFTEKAFTITVTNVNGAPTDISLSPSTVAENLGENTVVGTLNTTDPDPGDLFTYMLVAGIGDTDNAAFNLVGSTFRATNSFDFEIKSSYTIRVRSTDQSGLFTEKKLTINVSNVNESPIDIALFPSTIAENAGANATVGTLSTVDQDAANTFNYTLVNGIGDSDNSAFNISGSALRAVSNFDFETKSSFTVRVRSTDPGGEFTEKQFTISVSNVNDAPSDIDISSKTIVENSGENASVGTINTTDQDAASSFTYTLVTGTGDIDNSAFNLSGSTLRATNNLDFETKSSYTIRVRSTDQGGLFIEKAFTIAVTNANEAPSDIDLSSSAIAENADAVATIGTLTSTDPDVGNTFTYTLVNGIGSTDNVSFAIAGNQLRANTSFDFESKRNYAIRVRATDVGGLVFEKTFSVNVTDINEAPSLQLSNVVTSVPESNSTGLDVADVLIMDDALGTNEISLHGPDVAMFEVIDGKLKLKPSSLDFETKPSLRVTVSVNDSAVGATPDYSIDFVLSLANVPEVTGVVVVDGNGWLDSVRRVRVQWDMAVQLTNSALRWNKVDVENAIVSFTTQTSVINGRTVADMQFDGKYSDEVGLLNGDYQLSVMGDQVTAVNSNLVGMSFADRFLALRPKNPFEMRIDLASPVRIGVSSTMNVQLVGLNEVGNGIRYQIDWDADGIVDWTGLGGSSISIDNVSFASGGSRTVRGEAIRSGQSIAKGSKVVDVVPFTNPGPNWFSTLDVDLDNTISPLDVLRVVNRLNETSPATPYELRLDVDRDQSISPLDVLAIINHINANPNSEPPTPFASISMTDTGASDGLTSDLSVSGVVKELSSRLFVSLDGKARKEVVGAVDTDGQFNVTDAAMMLLFGGNLDGDHLLTLETVDGNGRRQAMDRQFTRISRLPSSFEIVTAVQNGGLSLAWTSAGNGLRYRVFRNMAGQSQQMIADGLSDLATQVVLPAGLNEVFVEAYDHVGNSSQSQVLRVQIG